MLRRRFLGAMTAIGAGSLASVATVELAKNASATPTHSGNAKTVTYSIQGFTCITCAVGLETLLLREKGVVSVKASYPEAKAVIQFDPSVITEAALMGFIEEAGFTAKEA
jgi:Cu+-exporting ATPase